MTKTAHDDENATDSTAGVPHAHGPGCEHDHEAAAPFVREAPKVGRNDACPCGSGKKFKKCCG